jgi:hypothetical protein
MRSNRLRTFALVFLLVLGRSQTRAYSLMTHELLIDLTWQDSIVPLLLSRYPNLTPAQLQQARAYAYGGCVIQDMGYYPFGDKFFSDLTHYVRSGDFVVSLFRNAHNANELAFAVGALSHYIGDSVGHPEATNLAVPLEFPKLRKRYGPLVNYAEGKHQHVQTEFAFDIDQISQHHMAPLSFLRHVGLKVPRRQLDIAFYETYGIADFSEYRGGRFNIREYRFAVRTFIPRIAYAVTVLHRRHEPVEPDTPDAIEIRKQVASASAENHWDKYRRKAGLETYTLAGLLFILPKVGPLTLVNVKGPNQQTEAAYLHSLMLSLETMRTSLDRFTPPQKGGSADSGTGDPPASAIDPHHPLPNRDLDTGHVVAPGGYSLTDETYADLLHRLTQTSKTPIPPGIVRDIQAYYADPKAPITTKRDPARWAQVQADLQTLATMPVNPEPADVPTYGGEQ